MNAALEYWIARYAIEAALIPKPRVAPAPVRTLLDVDMDDAALERKLGQLRWLRAGLGLAIGARVETEDQVEYLEAAE